MHAISLKEIYLSISNRDNCAELDGFNGFSFREIAADVGVESSARAWVRIGSAAIDPAPGVIAVRPHHVGLITANLGGGMIRLLSGNDGNAMRERPRSTRGIIAYRKV